METPDVLVVGGGISGLAIALKASQAGQRVLVLESENRVGGCIHSQRTREGFWFELGAHTTYNSYCAFLDMAVATGAVRELVPRGPARTCFGFLREGKYRWLTPPKVLLLLNWFEAALSFPLGIFARKEGRTMGEYFALLVGRRNFARVLSPFLAAVPSQSADEFPAAGDGSLFKKRPRREEYPRSFGFGESGLQAVCDGVAKAPGVEILKGVTVRRVESSDRGFAVETTDGRTFEAPLAAIAVPPHQAAAILKPGFPALSAIIERVKTITVETMGVVLPRENAWLPECAFVVPVGEIFHSVVTRDPFPDSRFRGFAFHFKAGVPREKKLQRMSEVLKLPVVALGEVFEKRVVLPSPRIGHAELLRELDRELAGSKLLVTGNYFAGLAIEDCVLRSNAEWARVTSV